MQRNLVMAKRTGRKATLIRLAKKRGWYDGHSGLEPHQDADENYFDGYHEGLGAPKEQHRNPYGVYDEQANASSQRAERSAVK